MRVRTFVPFITRPFRRLRTCVRDDTHVGLQRSISFSFVSGKRGMKNCWKFWQRARPFVVQTTLNKGGLILEWPPKKFSTPTRTQIHRHVRMSTRTLATLSRNSVRGQIALRDARISSRIRVSCWCTDTCKTLDYSTITPVIFHSLSISRLN